MIWWALRANKVEAFRRVANLVQRTSRDPFARRGPTVPVDRDELVQIALHDALVSIQKGEVRDGAGLTQTVRRSVWREVKRAQRLQTREMNFGSRHEEAFDSLIGPDLSPELSTILTEESRFAESEQASEVSLIYKDQKSAAQETRARIDLIAVDDELIRYLKLHPEEMYRLNPRRFEEIVAAILRDLGYVVELTGAGPDGGVDIVATQKTGVGHTLLLVDCKGYAPKRPVGVGIVRSMFGVTEQMRASMGLLATTSFFTQPAREFQKTIRHRMSLKDYEDLQEWLRNYGRGGSRRN